MTQTLEDAVHEAVDAYIAGNPKSFERNESASRSMPGGNTRTVLFHPPFPLAFESGAGARLTSLDGREYVDMLGEYTAGLFGHSDPRILAALHTTLGRGISFGGHNALEGELAEVLDLPAKRDPDYGRTASGVAVKRGIVAVDPKVIPLGTRIYIPGYGFAIAGDTGGGIKGNMIDLGYADGVAPDWHTGWVDIYLLAP